MKVCRQVFSPNRKEKTNVSVRTAWISFGALPCRKKKLDGSSRLDVVEIARVPDMLPSLFLPGRAKDLSAIWYICYRRIAINKAAKPCSFHCIERNFDRIHWNQELHFTEYIRPTIVFVNKPNWHTNFSYMFISILYIFRAAMCPSSGECLYQCGTWFRSLRVDDRLVCRSIPANQTVIYTEWHKPGGALIQTFSWWWTHSCPKNVENRNKHTWKICVSIWFVYKGYTRMHGQQSIKDRW